MAENPQNRERLEDEILAFFDGALGPESTERLMETVETNPEARALFESHQSLQDLIASARIPMDTPVETTRALAEKIPNLLVFLPGLIGGLETVPVLTQSANTFLTFLAKVPASMMISAGAAVTVMTAAGVYVATTNNSAEKNHTTTAHVRVAEAPKQDNPMNFQPAQNVASSQEVGSANATFKENPEAPKSSAPSNVANTNTPSAAVASIPASPAPAVGHPATPKVPATPKANAASNSEHLNAPNDVKMPQPTTPPAHAAKAIASSGNASAASAKSVTPAAAAKHGNAQHPANSTPDVNAPSKDLAQNENGTTNAVAMKAPESSIPEPIIGRTSLRIADGAVGAPNNIPQAHVLVNDYISSDDASNVKVSPFATLGLRLMFMPSFSENASGGRASRQGTVISPNVDAFAGVDFAFSNYFALRVGGGAGNFGQIVPQNYLIPSSAAVPINQYVTASHVEIMQLIYAKLLASYTLNPFDALRMTFDGGAGYAFSGGPLGQIGFRVAYDVTSNLTLRGGLAWEVASIGIKSDDNRVAAQSDAILIDRRLSPPNLIQNSLIPQIGFAFRF